MALTSTIDISELTPQQVNGVVAAAVAIGTLYCFLGYRTLRFILGLLGFIMAGGVAATIMNWITQGNDFAGLIALFLGGMCGAFALVFLYKTGVFLLGLLGAALVAHNILASRPETWIPLAVLGIAIAGGLIALLLEKPVVIFASSALGAWTVVSGVAYFFILDSTGLGGVGRAPESDDLRPIVLGSWAVLAVGGLLSQFATTRRKPKAKPG